MKQIRFVYQDQRGIHYDKLAKIILPPPLPFQIQNGCDMRTIKDALHILQQREIPRRLWNIENNQCKALFTISHFEMANQRGPFYTVFESDVIALAVSPDEDYIVVTKREEEEELGDGSSTTAVAVTPETSVNAVPTINTTTTAAVGKNASTGNSSDIASTRNTSTASSKASNSVEIRQAVTGNFVTPQKTFETQAATASAKTQTMNTNMNNKDSTAKNRQPEATNEKEKQDSTSSKQSKRTKVPSTHVNSQTSPYTYNQQDIAAKRKATEETEKTIASKKQKLLTTPRPTPPRKRKPPKDPKKPKHPKSAYLFFTMKQRSQLKDKMSVQEAGKMFGKAWKKLSNVEKAPFELMSHVEWIQYRKAMKDYQPSKEYLEDVKKYEVFKQKYNVRLKEYKEALRVYELEKEEHEKESENVERQDIMQVEAVPEKETPEECTVMNIDTVTKEHDSVQNQETENHMEHNDQEDDNEDDSQIIVILDSDSDSDESVFVHCSPQAQRVPDMIYSTHVKDEKKQSSSDVDGSQQAEESKSKESESNDDSVKAVMVDRYAVSKDKAAKNSSEMSMNETSRNSNDKKEEQASSSKVDQDRNSDLVIGEKYFIFTKRNEETLVELKEIDTKTNNVVVRMLGNKFSRTLCRDELLEYTEERREKYDNRVNQTKFGKGSKKSKTRKMNLIIGEKYFVQLSKKTPTAVKLVSLNDANGTAEIKTLRNFKSKEVKQSEIMEYTSELEHKWEQSQVERGSRVANIKSNEESSDKSSEKSSPPSSPNKSKEKPKASDGKTKEPKENQKEHLLTEDVKQKLMLQLRKRARVNPKDIWPLLFGPRLNSKNIPEYHSKKCIVQEEEDRRIYYASKGDTIKSIAKYYDIDVNQILYNNSSREGFAKLTATTKLKKNDGIILPIVKGEINNNRNSIHILCLVDL